MAKVDAEWHAQTSARLQREFSIVTKDILHSEEVVQSHAKQSLFEQTGAIAVDMESGVLARLAQTADIPFLIVRTVLDPANQGVPSAASSSVDRNGDLDAVALSRHLVAQPFQLAAGNTPCDAVSTRRPNSARYGPIRAAGVLLEH